MITVYIYISPASLFHSIYGSHKVRREKQSTSFPKYKNETVHQQHWDMITATLKDNLYVDLTIKNGMPQYTFATVIDWYVKHYMLLLLLLLWQMDNYRQQVSIRVKLHNFQDCTFTTNKIFQALAQS